MKSATCSAANPLTFSKTQKITISAMMMASYIVILYFTQSFSFGAYQIRIATTMYAAGYFCPFLIVPLGLANMISNTIFGGLGILDMVGGCIVGMTTTALAAGIRKANLPYWLVALPILFVPGLGVATYLSYLLQIPYPALALSLCIGQSVPAVCGVLVITAAERYGAVNWTAERS